MTNDVNVHTPPDTPVEVDVEMSVHSAEDPDMQESPAAARVRKASAARSSNDAPAHGNGRYDAPRSSHMASTATHAESGPPPAVEHIEKEEFSCSPFKGICADLKRRKPHYWSDWTDGCNMKVLSSTLFMVFTSIAPAITFAGVLSDETDNQLGPVEVILSTCVTGCFFALFSGQPLCIVGVTGPVTIFTVAIYKLADGFDIDFMPLYAWTQIWAALMHLIIAVLNLCELIKAVTRFSCESFGMLIAVVYLATGIKHLVTYFQEKELDAALLSLVLALGTCWLALLLSGARGWSIFNGSARVLIADYGTSAAVLFFCLVPYWGENEGITPSGYKDFNSTLHKDHTIAVLTVPDEFGTASGRGWIVNPMDCPTWAIFFAILPGAVLTVLYFFDHNVSSLLCQSPHFGLKKGTAYHWDFFVIGVQILITGILGIPPVNGLIPQAPMHTDSLCEKKLIVKNGRSVEVVTKCYEQRVSNFMQAAIIGCALSYVKGLGYLPIATLDGLFLYMGIASFGGNTFYERIVLLITDKKQLAARGLDLFVGKVPNKTINRFTALQFVILCIIFTITELPYVAGLFPVCIAILVPLRIYVLPSWFGKENVDMLDAEQERPSAADLDAASGASPTNTNPIRDADVATPAVVGS